MKKSVLFFMFCIVTASMVCAQDSLGLKPRGGDKNLELQFTPFGSPVIQINGIRGRLFQSSTRALRANVFLGYTSSSTITQQAVDSVDQEQLKDASSTFTLNIRPGMEIHMPGTNRLSPYVGAEADLAIQMTRSTSESQSPTSTAVYTSTVINNSGFFRFGVNAVAGFDFYLAKSLYMGTELGYGLAFTKNLSTKMKSDVPGSIEPDPTKKGGSFNLGPNVNAAIRLGYIFR